MEEIFPRFWIIIFCMKLFHIVTEKFGAKINEFTPQFSDKIPWVNGGNWNGRFLYEADEPFVDYLSAKALKQLDLLGKDDELDFDISWLLGLNGYETQFAAAPLSEIKTIELEENYSKPGCFYKDAADYKDLKVRLEEADRKSDAQLIDDVIIKTFISNQ